VLNDAIAGLNDYLENGLVLSAEMLECRAALFDDYNSMNPFMDLSVVGHEGSSTAVADIRKAYESFCYSRGFSTISESVMVETLRAKFPKARMLAFTGPDGLQTMVFHGLFLRAERFSGVSQEQVSSPATVSEVNVSEESGVTSPEVTGIPVSPNPTVPATEKDPRALNGLSGEKAPGIAFDLLRM